MHIVIHKELALNILLFLFNAYHMCIRIHYCEYVSFMNENHDSLRSCQIY